MAGKSLEDRILHYLFEATSDSNSKIKQRFKLLDNKYEEIKNILINKNHIEKFQCRGGGIKITTIGNKHIQKTINSQTSKYSKETELYEPFILTLKREIADSNENAILLNTSSLKKKGKWSNPDVIKISHRNYPLLRSESIAIITYEIKPLNNWDNSSVYETASHSRFSNESYVVLEWPKDENYEDLEDTLSLCRSFKVGLITIHPYYNSFNYVVHNESEIRNPSLELTEDYLTYIFDRLPGSKTKYDSLFKL